MVAAIATRIPPEILGAIFLTVKRTDRRLLSYSLVCKHWRDVVTSTHALWATIRIATDGPDVTPAFQRSGEYPLDVSIVDSSQAAERKPVFGKALEMVKDNFKRVRSLQIRSVDQEFVDSILNPYVQQSVGAPTLEEFVIAAPEGYTEQDSPTVSSSILEHLFHPSPQLTRLTLALPEDVPESSSLLTTVTHLTIDRGVDSQGVGMGDYLALIRVVAPRLQSLTYVGYDIFSYQGLNEEPRSIAAPELTKLDMWVPSSGFEIVPFLAMPALETLHLTDDRPEDYAEDWVDGDYTPLSDVLKSLRADCPLKQVEIVNLRCLNPDTYTAFLETTSAEEGDKLEKLVIRKGTLTDEVLDGATLSPTVKRLEFWAIPGIRGPIVKSFIERSLIDRPTPLELVVEGCDNVSVGDLEGFDRSKVAITNGSD